MPEIYLPSPPSSEKPPGRRENSKPTRSPIHRAAASGDIDELQRLIAQSPLSVNDLDGFNRAPLHVALHLPIAAALLLAGADPGVKLHGMDTSTWHRKRGREELAALLDLPTSATKVKQCVDKGRDVAAVDLANAALRLAHRWLPRSSVVQQLKIELQRAQQLREARMGMEVAYRDEQYTHALHACQRACSLAPHCGHLKTRQEALERLSALQLELTELHNSTTSIAERVASAALTPPRRTVSQRNSTLRRRINAALVQRLLDDPNCGSINQADDKGQTPLMWAVENSCEDLINLLLTRSGAIVSSCAWIKTDCVHSDRAIDSSIRPGSSFYCEYDSANAGMDRVNVNLADSKGRTALHLAQNVKVAAQLLCAGADVKLCNKEGRTPVQQHRRYHRDGIVALLESNLADVCLLYGKAERKLHCGDARAAVEGFRDAIDILCQEMPSKCALISDCVSRERLEADIRDGMRRALLLSSALSQVSVDEAVLKQATPLQVPLPSQISNKGQVSADDAIYCRLGQLQALLNHRAPGRWKIVSCLGVGASGIVVHCLDRVRRDVAVKLVLPEGTAVWTSQNTPSRQCSESANLANKKRIDPMYSPFRSQDAARLRREAQAAMRVASADDASSQHVCACFEYWSFPSDQHSLAFVMIMELAQGPTLEYKLQQQHKPCTEIEAASVCADVLRGLRAVHSVGLVHRDIKPANIAQCTTTGKYKLLDFGLARAFEQKVKATSDSREDIGSTLLQMTCDDAAPAGTPHYMAPEQWSCQAWGSITDKADLWAVGVLAFRLLTGILPYAPHATRREEIWQAVCGAHTQVPDLRRVADRLGAKLSVSDGIAAWVTKALQQEPTKRYQSAADMEQALHRALVANRLARYEVFLSYRVVSDRFTAQSLFTILSCGSENNDAKSGQPNSPLNVYLDRVRLVDGQRWDEGFISGLLSSDIFVPLVSLGAIKPMAALNDAHISTPNGEQLCDNVLLEWMLALYLFNAGHIKAILPLLMGAPTTSSWNSLFDDLDALKAGGWALPSTVHEPTRTKAVEAVRLLGLESDSESDEVISAQFDHLTVENVIQQIVLFQGLPLWQAAADSDSALRTAADKIGKLAETLHRHQQSQASSTEDTKLKFVQQFARGAKNTPTLDAILSPSATEVIRLRQELMEARATAAQHASAVSAQQVQLAKITEERNEALALLSVARTRASKSYTDELMAKLRSENEGLRRGAAKWKDKAVQRQQEVMALRNRQLDLAKQASESRQIVCNMLTNKQYNRQDTNMLGHSSRNRSMYRLPVLSR